MTGLGVCARCENTVAANRLEYAPSGDLVCTSCSARALSRSHAEGEGLTRARGLLSVGLGLGSLGAASAVLAPLGMNLRLLTWIDSAGPAVGWGIRGFLILAGGSLALVGSRLLKRAALARA